MRVIFCRCFCEYSGRIDAQLELGDRVIILKDDGAVVVHGKNGTNAKNWMPPQSVWSESDGRFTSEHIKRGEKLEIYVEEIFAQMECKADLDGKLIKIGSEREMSDLLASQMDRIEEGLMLVSREAKTPVGPIDILATDNKATPVVIEVKRGIGVSSETVYQLARYLEVLPKMSEWKGTSPRGILVAPGLKKGVRELLKEREIGYVRIGYQDLKDDLRNANREKPSR
jgi:RecB family endonuclease NucS